LQKGGMRYVGPIETASINPALEAFASQITSELVIAQVLLRRQPDGWQLRHTTDRLVAEAALKEVDLTGLRDLAQFTQSGSFRPLKSAPNLRSGWKTNIGSLADLGMALNYFYPGFLADWYAIHCRKSEGAPFSITHYREFTGRQTGMYRITQQLTDSQAAITIRACCHPRFCLKQRLWTVGGQAPDQAETKSLIPCLEPCAVMLEFTRTVARLEQSPPVAIRSGDATIAASLRENVGNPPFGLREADFGAPENPRRLQLALEKIQQTGDAGYKAAARTD
jgi:hypothetical protein